MNEILKSVEIFTDGACRKNPGPGGWCAILRYRDIERQLTGCASMTTNNRMELTAVLEGLNALKEPCRVKVYTDSLYLRDGISKWIHKWKRNGWKTGSGPVKNKDLWEALELASQRHEVEWIWVRGHDGHPENERCDRGARLAIKP